VKTKQEDAADVDSPRVPAARRTVNRVTLPSARILGLTLGAIFVLFGVVEVITHRDDSVGALAFWGLSLLGGGALVLAGTVVRRTSRRWGLVLVTIGALAGTNATLWTLLVPVVAIVTVVVAFRERGPAAAAA
jgi:hypothetical protein